MALARARDDAAVEQERDACDYLVSRGLSEAWEHGVFGILPRGQHLPAAVASWPAKGYRLVVPLYGQEGVITNMQARSILPHASTKVLFPKGSAVRGTVFADARGLEVLRGTWKGERRAVLGEGLTDFLALTIASPWPVLSVPGTSFAASSVGAWVRDFEVLLALDCDPMGEAVVEEAARAAFLHGARRVVRVEWPRGHKDACEVLTESGVAGLLSFLESCSGRAPR